MTKYRTIVADPPWAYDEGTSRQARCQRCSRVRYADAKTRCNCETPDFKPYAHSLPYSSMTLQEIEELPVGSLADGNCNLYLWTTQRYLRATFGIAESWGFTPRLTLTWGKPAKGLSAGPFVNSSEFILYAVRGNAERVGCHMGTVFTWPRRAHSAKPEAFLDIVEQVSPGPYVELFARRARFGWDYWGNESLGTASMEAAA